MKNQIILRRRKGNQETVTGVLGMRREGGVGERLEAKMFPPHPTKGTLCFFLPRASA